jgi:flagellin
MLTVLDSAIGTVSTRRGNLGAVQNRLGSTIANLEIASENLSAANSRIADADFAIETANLTRSQIILQAGVAVLAQANTIPQYALQLLS